MLYSEHSFWSPMFGAPAVRLSMVDDRGGEFWRVIERDQSAKRYREARDLVLDEIEAAISRGAEPGEVVGGETR